MAANTDPRLQNQVIYSIYVRNHTPAGTFRAVIPDLDPIDRRTGHDLSGLLRRLYAVKHQLGSADWFFADADDANDLALLQRGSAGKRFVGVFSLKAKAADVRVDAADGVYENLIDRSAVTVKNGILSCTGEPVILRAEG
jgi:glycosidase family protein